MTSPIIFNYAVDWVLHNAVKSCQALGYDIGVIVNGVLISDMDYADDVGLIAKTESAMNAFLSEVARFGKMIGLNISCPKSKVIYAHVTEPVVEVEGEHLECVSSFKYLGSELCGNGDAGNEIAARIANASKVFESLRARLWNRSEISVTTKCRIYHASVRSVLLYGCETWPLKINDIRKMEAFEHRCLRRICNIKLEDFISNQKVRKLCNMTEPLGAHTYQETTLYMAWSHITYAGWTIP